MRSLIIVLFLLIYLIVTLPVMVVEFVIRIFDRKTSEKHCRWLIIRLMKAANFIAGVDLEVKGLENIPEGETVLFVPNHRSYLDFTVLFPLLSDPSLFVGKKELAMVPLFGQWVYLIGTLILDRKNRRQGYNVIYRAADLVKDGSNIIIFPEGTRNKGDIMEPLRFKEGSLKISSKSGCKTVPVALIGTREIYECHRPWVKPGKVKVIFGKPIDPAELSEYDLKNYGAYTRERIIEMLKAEA